MNHLNKNAKIVETNTYLNRVMNGMKLKLLNQMWQQFLHERN